MRKKLGVLTCIFLLISIVISSCSPTGAQDQSGQTLDKEPYKIGVVLTLTGPANTFGLLEKDGAELARDIINKNGGVDGHPIELIIYDDESQPTNSVNLANKLITEDNVIGIVGATLGSGTMAISPVLKRYGVPLIAPNSTISVTEHGNKWIFRTAATDRLYVQAMLAYLVKHLQADKIAVIHGNDAFGQAASEEITLNANKGGLAVEILANEEYALSDTDMTAQLTKIRGTNPEVLIVWGTAPSASIALRNAKQLGFTIPVLGSGGMANQAMIDTAGDAAEGIVLPGVIDPQNPLPRQKDFVTEIKNRTGRDATFFEAIAYDAVLLFAEAMKTAGNDREKVRDTLETINNFQGASGVYSYSTIDHDGLDPSAVIYLKVENGKFKRMEIED